jgi:hypothetical protein
MMNDNILDTGIQESSMLTNEAKSYLYEAAKWGKFLSIVGFVFVGFMVIIAMFAGSFLAAFSPGAGAMLGSSLITLMYLAVAIIYLMPCLYLYRFSTKTKLALDLGSSIDLTNALGNLKSMLKFMGIFTAAILGLYVLMIVFGLLSGLVSTF